MLLIIHQDWCGSCQSKLETLENQHLLTLALLIITSASLSNQIYVKWVFCFVTVPKLAAEEMCLNPPSMPSFCLGLSPCSNIGKFWYIVVICYMHGSIVNCSFVLLCQHWFTKRCSASPF